MANSSLRAVGGDADHRALVLALSCPEDDLIGAREVLARHDTVLLPAGGPGDLERSAGIETLYIIAVTQGGVRAAATWRADLAMSTPLTEPRPELLLPPSWRARHPRAYAQAREQTPDTAPGDADLWDDDEPEPQQIFVPIVALVELPRSEWIFSNELVPKQDRRGRSFAPRVPTLVKLPD